MPDDFYAELGLAALISPLRLRGMSAMLTRIKRRLREAELNLLISRGTGSFASNERRLDCRANLFLRRS